MDFGVASHTSLSDSPVAHPSLFPFSGETNKYVIFGRTWCYWTFLSDFIWAWEVTGVTIWYQSGFHPGSVRDGVKSSSFVLRLIRFSTDVQQLREVQVRQFSRELSVSSDMISRLSRSGYMTFLPPAHFKQSVVDRFRDVSVWTTDIGHWELFISIAGYQLCLEGRFVRIFIRDGATFLRCYPWDGLIVTASSSVGLPDGKSSDCWSRWKLLVHACYILRSYGIQGHRDF
ncbi:hypothetical protein YC2023_098631 [Brassica napus]